MTTKLFFDRVAVPDVRGLVASYNADEFESPTRSTIPLLALLLHGGQVLSQLHQELGIPAGADLHCEYKVPPARGKGLPSQTDLMVLSGDSAWAIEAKWTEPRYETVGTRIDRDDDKSNRTEVLRGWLAMIQPFAMRPITEDTVRDSVYQMIHRTASACASAANPTLAYLVFHLAGAAQEDFYRADLARLHDALGSPKRLAFYYATVQLTPTAAFEAIQPLPKGPTSAPAVREALLSNKLFEFDAPVVTRI